MIIERRTSPRMTRFPEGVLATLLVAGASQLAGCVEPTVADSPDPLGQQIVLADFPYCQPSEQTPGHPGPQFRPPAPASQPDPDNPNLGYQQTADGTTVVHTSETCLPEPRVDPFTLPPGTNLLANVYTDMRDGLGETMPHTLPSTPTIPYNLHYAEPVVTTLDNAFSPVDDLLAILNELEIRLADGGGSVAGVTERLDFAVDILEGEPLSPPDGRARYYEGLPVLHYKGPEKSRAIERSDEYPGFAGVVDVKQVWYDEYIESDVAFFDPSAVLDEPWLIRYSIYTLDRGTDDFSPFAIFTDNPERTDAEWRTHLPGRGRLDHIGMDQTFFPMEQGTLTELTIKVPPGKYLNLSYTWGWRMHPPRIQAVENGLKKFPPTPAPTAENPDPSAPPLVDTQGNPVPQRSLPEWEEYVFGVNEDGSAKTKEEAIGMIGDLSPAKRMWQQFRAARVAVAASDNVGARDAVVAAREAYRDWQSRSRLPDGVDVDPGSDITILYVNNTIYGELTNEDQPLRFPEVRWPDWKLRGATLNVTAYNGDYFQHAYMNVDFGGARGWENQFKSSIKVGGSGCWFTFGRAHWAMNLKPAIVLAPAEGLEPEVHRFEITYNSEPSTRLRFYQFDPMHHDVAIYSIH